jgi:hypothetical protein
MKLHHLLLLCALGLFLGSCKTSTTPGDTATLQQLFPLSVGNWWSYHTLEYNNDGTPSADYLDTLNILRTEVFQNIQGFVLAFTHSGDPGFLYYSGADLFSEQDPPGSETPYMFLHYPMNTGQAIVVRDTTYSDGNRDQELFIFRGIESVAVPAGSFSCHHFTRLSISASSNNTPDSSSSDFYYSPGIGLVKNMQSYTSLGQKVTSPITTLTGYGKK